MDVDDSTRSDLDGEEIEDDDSSLRIISKEMRITPELLK